VKIFDSPLLEHYFANYPVTLVDIGARGGLQPNWAPLRSRLRLIGLEPDPAEHARLSAAREDYATLYINAAAYSGPAQLTLNVARAPGTSSVFEPNRAFLTSFPDSERFDTVEKVTIRADALDRLLPDHGVEDVDFLKIDTQGAETPILDGARNVLRQNVIGVEVEVQYAPLYIGQSLFGDADERLRQAGFQLFDLRPVYWKRTAGVRHGGPKGQLVFADALYLKTADAIRALLDRVDSGEKRRAKFLHALAICVLYGYIDFALDLFERHRGLLDPQQEHALQRALTSSTYISYRIPQFRGRGWLSNLFLRLSLALRPSVGGWGTGARNLGNID
jgi:FkbM family methyltransferase